MCPASPGQTHILLALHCGCREVAAGSLNTHHVSTVAGRHERRSPSANDKLLVLLTAPTAKAL